MNWQFWFFRLSLPEKSIPGQKHKNCYCECVHGHYSLYLTFSHRDWPTQWHFNVSFPSSCRNKKTNSTNPAKRQSVWSLLLNNVTSLPVLIRQKVALFNTNSHFTFSLHFNFFLSRNISHSTMPKFWLDASIVPIVKIRKFELKSFHFFTKSLWKSDSPSKKNV